MNALERFTRHSTADVFEHIVRQHPDSTILIVCSGSADNFNLEDFYGAGYLVSLFHSRTTSAEFSDAALAAELLHDHCDGLDALRRARGGRMMLARRLDELDGDGAPWMFR